MIGNRLWLKTHALPANAREPLHIVTVLRTMADEYDAGHAWTEVDSYQVRAAADIIATTTEVSEAIAERFSAGVSKNWQGRRSGRDGDAIMAGLTAALSSAPSGDGMPGMVLVPREPGWEMKVAARDIDWPRPNIYGQFSDSDKERAAAEIWSAMLSTASTAGAGE